MHNTLVALVVEHQEPVLEPFGRFCLEFCLKLKVDTGSGVGIGRSHPTTACIQSRSIQDARKAAFAIEVMATRRLKDMDIVEAMRVFPDTIMELALQMEP